MTFSLTLVGTRGRMGGMFRDAWAERHPVYEVNRTRDASGRAAYREEDLAAGIGRGDVVVLCVPAPAMPRALERVVPHMRDGQILMDVCSVKIKPMRWMEEGFAGPVIGTHPLFGPENGHIGANVAMVRGRRAGDADADRVASLFREMGCRVIETTAEEHDGAVGITQSLHFAMAAGYFAAAAEHPNLAPYVTPSFRRFLDAARSELTENAPMFREFTEANPLFPGILAAFAERLGTAAPRDLETLVARAGAWYPGNSEKSGSAAG